MSELKDTIQCPICKLEIDPLVAFCPACGYKEPVKPPVDYLKIQNTQERSNAMFPELARKAAGPVNFAFPEVAPTYVFKPGDKRVSSRALLGLIGAGMATAIAGGPLLYLLVYLLGLAGAVMLANNANCMAIGVMLIYAVVAVPVGLLIGKAVSHTALKMQCRSVRTVQVVSLLSAIACFISYLVFYTLILGAGEGYDSVIDFLKLSAYLLALTISAWQNSRSDIEKTPFCEQCQVYMKDIHWGDRMNIGWSIGYENRLLNNFQNQRYRELPELPLVKDPFWFSRVIATIWYCPKCNDEGFIDLETIQIRRRFVNNKESSEVQTRLIYSAELHREQISELLAISDKIQLPPKTK